MNCRVWIVFLLAVGVGRVGAWADAPATLTLHEPRPYQVIQRHGFDPKRAHANEPGGPALGHGDVPIAGAFYLPEGARCQCRAVRLADAFGRDTDWADVGLERRAAEVHGKVRLPAGGWYRLEVRVVAGEKTIAQGKVEPIGIGEVFVIAGQSYAAGANDEVLKVEEPGGRVASCDVVGPTWRIAHDPPHPNEGGTIWPPLGDLLVPVLHVPVGFVNVAVGGTASRQWLPGEKLYANLAAAGKTIGGFRAVLWQQGESDVIEKVSTETYVQHLCAIREGLAREWGFEPPWLAAKSTLHPTVYINPAGEGRIRDAIDLLWKMRGFRPGPDTDILGGDNRGGPKSMRHFSGIGQRRAALLWFAAIWNELHRDSPQPADEAGFTPLFDGRTLSGWEGDTTLWKAEEGAIVGDSAGIQRNEFLATERRFGDFELRLDFRLHGGKGNSGIQFRSERVPQGREVSGYQADIGESYWGCLYDESRRNKVLARPPAELEAVLRHDDWNSYSIRAEGPRVTLRINGLTTVDYLELHDQLPRTGIIALQLHSGPPLKVEFRNLRIKNLSP